MTTLRCLFVSLVIGTAVWWTAMGQAAPSSSAPSGENGNDDNAVRVVSLPGTKDDVPSEIYVTHPKGKPPAAVLLLFPQPNVDAKILLSKPAWQHFAQDHSLGLVSVPTFHGDTKFVSEMQAPLNVGRVGLILQALDQEFGGRPALFLYGWPQKDALAESFLLNNPARIRGWCFHAPKHLPDAGKAMSPGVLVVYKEREKDYKTLMGDFTQGRKADERITWLALPGDAPESDQSPDLDAFVRGYFDALLNFHVGRDQWQNIETKEPISVMDVNSHRDLASYLPNASLAVAWADLHVPGGPTTAQDAVIEREVDTHNEAQPKLRLYLRKPLSASRQGAKVEGVFAISTQKKDRGTLLGILQNHNNPLVQFAEEHHLAMLTWNTARAWSVAESADQRDRQQNREDDRSFDQLADAWEHGVQALCHETGIPDNNFLLYGISQGAQWAHRLVLRKPQYFFAVHIHINSSYDWPTPAAKNILWLQTTGEREAGYEAAKRFYARCRDLGYPIIFKAGENLGHSDSPQIDAISRQFFDYALGVKAKRDAMVASAKTFNSQPGGADLYTLSGQAAAPYYADFINQEVYRAVEKEMIPAGQRVPLPTKSLAQAWGEIVDDAPAVRFVSNSSAAASKASVVQPPSTPPEKSKINYFGSSAPPSDQPPQASITGQTDPTRATATPTPSKLNTSAGPLPKVPSLPAADQPTAKTRDRPLSQLADGSLPKPIQANDALKASMHPGEATLRSGFQQAYELSIQRATKLYPALGQAGSPMNIAFVAEYQRLKAVGDPVLTDASWPERVARTVGERLAQSPASTAQNGSR